MDSFEQPLNSRRSGLDALHVGATNGSSASSVRGSSPLRLFAFSTLTITHARVHPVTYTRMNLREQLRHLLPEILPDDPAEAIKGTELIRLVRHRLGEGYSDATLRYHFSILSYDPTSPASSMRRARAISAGRVSCAWSPSMNASASSARAIPSC
jgi:hypothetical protein